MLCKYYIKLGSSTIGDAPEGCIEVSNCIRNLDSLKVSYARTDLGGVVRKCGSEIEFTGKAYDAIIDYYKVAYLQSCGVFAVFIADNNWRYTKLWDCPLDFATLHYDGFVATLGCVDNGAAAIIKANGKSKYEIPVNSIAEQNKLVYNGVVTKRSFTFNVVGAQPAGESTTDMISTKEIYLASKDYYSLWFPAIGVSTESYSSEAFTVMDQNESRAWNTGLTLAKNDGLYVNYECSKGRAGFIKCVLDGSIHIDMDLRFRFTKNQNWMRGLSLKTSFILTAGETVVYRKEVVDYGDVDVNIHMDVPCKAGQIIAFCLSTTSPYRSNWMDYKLPDGSLWKNTDLWFDLGLRWASNTQTAYVNESSYEDKPIELQVMKPITLLQALLDKMFDKWPYGCVLGEISEENNVFNNTLIVAAESIRKIATNKVYSTFNDFAKFLESVFGFVYTIEYQGMLMDKELEAVRVGDAHTIKHINVGELVNESMNNAATAGINFMYPCGGIINEDMGSKIYYGTKLNYEGMDHYNCDNVYYDEIHNVFLFHDTANDKYYVNWDMVNLIFKSDMYNENGHAREMLGVNLAGIYSANNLFGVVFNGSLVMCDGVHGTLWLDERENTEPVTLLRFTHRTNVFSDDVIKHIDNCNNIQYQFDEGKVYSAIEVGYTKKDYQNDNSAKNEFNFTNYYNTDTILTDNTLSLICPYRSDCYGIEELLVKNKDSEATSSDDDVFIVVSKKNNDGTWSIDRDTAVENAYTDTVFNAALAPNVIVKNNEEYIGSFAKKLTFTSSDGNSSAVIGGLPMSTNINIAKQLFKSGKISIDTGDIVLPENWNGIIEFEYNGRTYRGYLDSIDINFAYAGTLTYNLIEKCIE